MEIKIPVIMSGFSAFFYNSATYFLGGAACVFTFLWLWKFRRKLGFSKPAAAIVTALIMALGFFSIKAFSVIEMLSLEGLGKMSLFGAIFIMPLFIYLIAKALKIDKYAFFDITSICLVFTIICGRANCIIYGCCKGIPFFGNENFLWPQREMEIAFNTIMLFILGYIAIKEKTNGEVYPVYALSYGIFRFLIEFVREAETEAFIHPGHICALISICIGISGLVYLKKFRFRKI